MAIEIYAYTPAPEGALFPAMESSLRLHAVAPLEKRQDIELWCTMMNQEAAEAGVQRKYKYVVTTVLIWK